MFYRFFCISMILVAPLCGQTVGSAISLSASQNAITQGSVVTLTATVTVNGAPATGGTVNFLDGTRSLGTVQVIVSGAAMGTAVLRTRSFAIGSHNLTANYSGALNGAQHAAASSSSTTVLTVQSNGAATSVTTLTPTQDPTGLYDLTASVATLGVPPPSGTVSFIDQTSGASLGSAAFTTGALATFPQIFQSSYATTQNPTSAIVSDFNQERNFGLGCGTR